MVEVTKEALADARRWMCALPRDQFDKLLVLGEDARQAGVQQGLDMAAGWWRKVLHAGETNPAQRPTRGKAAIMKQWRLPASTSQPQSAS